MPFTTDVDHKVPYGITFRDARGNAGALVDGVPAWTSSDETIMTAVAATDGMTAYAVPTGAPGTAQILMRADADLGEGVRTIEAVDTVTFTAGEAAAAVLTPGVAVPL